MIEHICMYDTKLVMGISALIGAGIYATYNIIKQSKEDKNFKFDLKKTIDTAWQSITAGAVAGVSLGCGYTGILTAMVVGVGIDKLTNKSKILNLVEIIGNLLTKADKNQSKTKKKK